MIEFNGIILRGKQKSRMCLLHIFSMKMLHMLCFLSLAVFDYIIFFIESVSNVKIRLA